MISVRAHMRHSLKCIGDWTGMNGVFVSNAYLRDPKFAEPAQMLSAAAKEMGIGLRCITNADLPCAIGASSEFEDILGEYGDFVIFWDKDVRLARNLQVCGYQVFNAPRCIEVCDDKAMTHIVLADHMIPSIETLVCPMCFGEYPDLDFLEEAVYRLGFPMVVKDCYGSLGMQVRLVRDVESLRDIFRGPYVPRILQRYIECSSTDIRLEVVGGEVVASVLRHGPPGDFRSNCSIGGRMIPYRPTRQESDLAVAAADAVGADFCGVDIIRTGEGPKVCEVNSNAHIRNLYECTGRDVSYDILGHIEKMIW